MQQSETTQTSTKQDSADTSKNEQNRVQLTIKLLRRFGFILICCFERMSLLLRPSSPFKMIIFQRRVHMKLQSQQKLFFKFVSLD
jgi:hypothetical protein